MCGYCFGFGFFACGLFWINNALLLDLPRLGWLIPLSFMGSGLFFGLFVAIPALFCYHKNIYAQILAFAAWWVLFEWIRSFIFTGFPWNLLGSVLAFEPAGLQLASVIGTYGLSLLVIILCSLPAALFTDTNKKRSIIANLALLPFLAVLIWGYGFYRIHSLAPESPSELQIRIVQPAIPQQMKWQEEALFENLQTYIRLSQENLPANTKLIIWGETATPFPISVEPHYLDYLTQAVPPSGYLITGLFDYAVKEDEWKPLNAMATIDTNAKVAAYYKKSHLVPFGEYIPFRKWFPKSLRPVTNVISDFGSGNGVETIHLPEIPPFGISICYEIIFPAEIVNQNDRPQWLINLTNDGWYGLSAGPYQHLTAARLRAVEEGLTIVRAANSGISALISKTGAILNKLDLQQSGQLDFYLPQVPAIHTVYGKYQNYITIMLCLIVLLSSFFIAKKI